MYWFKSYGNFSELGDFAHMEKWQNSSCGEACHPQDYCVCWCCCWGWTSFNNPCRHTHGNCAAKLCAGSAFAMAWMLCHKHYSGEPSLSLVLCPPLTDPIQQQHDFPQNRPLTPTGLGASRWAPLFMCSLKADPILEGDVADDKASGSMCISSMWWFNSFLVKIILK